jgi:hypothetical protein
MCESEAILHLYVGQNTNATLEDAPMIRVDAYFFYQLGAHLKPLTQIGNEIERFELVVKIYGAKTWLEGLLNQSVVRIRTARPKGTELFQTISRVEEEISAQTKQNKESLSEPAQWNDIHAIKSQSEEFQTLLAAELSLGDIYVVSPKGGFDTTTLAEYGYRIFPEEMANKVPESLNDANESARCIAFALPTAAAFHLHRVHELVLRKYYDAVTGGKPRPEKRNIGSYMDALKNHHVNDQIILGALAGLKNFHRNPVLHPDDRLENIEETIALHGQIVSVITYMLKKIPENFQLAPPPAIPEQ